jgi:hypothetical protein
LFGRSAFLISKFKKVNGIIRRVWRYQRDKQNPYIEEEQTTQCPKEKVQKDKQRSTKHTYKTEDQVTRIPLKTGVNSGAPEGKQLLKHPFLYLCVMTKLQDILRSKNTIKENIFVGLQGRILKLEKIWFVGVKSWIFTRNTPNNFAPPSAIGKNMIFWRTIVIFHPKYPKNFRSSLHSAQFSEVRPPSLKSWIRPWFGLVYGV